MVEATTEALHGGTVLWCAPTYKQVAIGWRECVKACSALIEAGVVRVNKSEQFFEFPRGGRIYFVSLDDPDNARGFTATLIIIDEAADCVEYAWKEVLRPMLMDTKGRLWAIGTPKGRNWFWAEYEKAQLQWKEFRAGTRAVAPNRQSWSVPTKGCEIKYDPQTGVPYLVDFAHPYENPDIPFDELADMWEEMTERAFRQEVMAEFMDNADGVFLRYRDTIDWQRTANLPPDPVHGRYQMGVDVATIRDFTVIDIFDLNTGKQVFFKRFNQRGWQRVYDEVETAAKTYNARVYFDSTGVGDPPYEELRRRGLNIKPIKFNNTIKRDIIEHHAALLEHKRISMMNIDQQTFEYEAYQYEKTPMGAVTTNAPEGKNDDCVIGGALATWEWKPNLKGGGGGRELSIGHVSDYCQVRTTHSLSSLW